MPNRTDPRRAVLYLTWGESQAALVAASVRESRLDPYDVYWVTDVVPEDVPPEITVIEATYKGARGNLAKAQLGSFLPPGYDSYLFLDSDTRVLGNVELGFQLAERAGIAMVPAPVYSLANYMNGREIMAAEGIPCRGQMIYNTGVIFFAAGIQVVEVLALWRELAVRLESKSRSDQLLLGIAMLKLEFEPAALSPNFNYRAFGDRIVGEVRIWHSPDRVPRSLNRFPKVTRRVVRGRMRTWGGIRRIRLPYWLRPYLGER